MAPIARRWSGPLLALLLAWGGVASAAPRLLPLAVRPQEGVLEKSGVKLNGLLVDELKTRDPDFQLLSPLRSGQKVKLPSNKPAPEAVAAMDRARLAMRNLDLRNAVAEYYQAATLSLGDAATTDFAAVHEAYLQIAVAAFRLGREKEADRALTNLIRMDPNVKIPGGKYPPVFLRFADRARDRLERGGRGAISVDGPPGARVFVDGRLIGPVPARVPKIYAGEHHVQVEGTQGERFGQVVQVVSGEEVFVQASFVTAAELALMSTVPPDAQPLLDAAFEQRLRAYCQAVDAQFALVAILMHTEDHRFVLASALYSARRGGFTVLEQRTMDELMNGANVEVYRLTDAVVASIRNFGEPVLLPVSLKVRPPPTGSPPLETARSDPAGRESARPRLIPEGPPSGGTTVTSAPMGGGQPPQGGRDRPPETVDQWAAGVPWWGWTLVGVGAGLIVGGATYAIVQANRPISGTVIVRW
ncbi:MAG TPA: PEGA domain-containing protein [Myxococcales bacterium]|nr:PEGA domain-containing protein [Myxococcales bacterium]